MAQRSIYNIYSVVSALFRDAALEGLIDASPCILTEAQLGPLVDSDPEWRAGSVFTREEAEALIGDPRIPADRQLVYGFGLLAGMRPGEVAALRWRHWDPSVVPLGQLLVALSYSTRKHRAKGTKTDVVRHVPVHPTLAAMLAEWRRSGWAAMMGREPGADDLIVPLPPAAANARRSRTGEAYRSNDYSGKRWREEDLPALGWRYRELYATKSTFITLACKDGADPDVIESRVTHTKKSRSAFDGYRRDSQWPETCNEVAKLRITRRARVTVHVTDLATRRDLAGNLVEAAGVEPAAASRLARWAGSNRPAAKRCRASAQNRSTAAGSGGSAVVIRRACSCSERSPPYCATSAAVTGWTRMWRWRRSVRPCDHTQT